MSWINDPDAHLSPDALVERVFPGDERPVGVPAHLASCGVCQARVGRLREAWLLDRGAVAGTVEALPPEFWETQVQSVMRQVGEERMAETAAEASFQSTGVHPFPVTRSRSFVRHPVLAISSLAAALVLVTGLTVLHFRTRSASDIALNHPQAATSSAVAPVKSDTADDELLRSIDKLLAEDGSYSSLLTEETL